MGLRDIIQFDGWDEDFSEIKVSSDKEGNSILTFKDGTILHAELDLLDLAL